MYRRRKKKGKTHGLLVGRFFSLRKLCFFIFFSLSLCFNFLGFLDLSYYNSSKLDNYHIITIRVFLKHAITNE
jgi:hypothetical protein